MWKIAGLLYLMYSAFVFFTLMLIACPLIILSTVLFSRRTGKNISFFLLKCWAWTFSLLTFIWFSRNQVSNVDQTRPYIYVGNHASFLDAIAIVICIPQAFSPLGKIEMLKIPVFGWIYKRLVVMVDRNSRESRDQSIIALRKELQGGQSILIFPEGTMNKSNTKLNPFFDGAFRLAIETQIPIMPFAILNSKDHLPRTDPLKLKPGLIKTIFGEAIEVKGMVSENTVQLKDRTYQSILNLLNQKNNV